MENEIKRILPAIFALIFDGWDQEQTQTKYVALFASFLHANAPKKGTLVFRLLVKPFIDSLVLLAFSPMLEADFDFTSQSHKNLIEHVLGNFNRTLDDVICLVGDNCNTNSHLADLCGVPLVGCASHRFNLDVQLLLSTPAYDLILEKVFLFHSISSACTLLIC